MNTITKKLFYTFLVLTITSSNAHGASFIERHAVKAAGTATGLCTAKFLHTTIKGWRQKTGIPFRSRKYQLNALAILGGAYLIYWLNQKNTVAVPTPPVVPVIPADARPAEQQAAAVAGVAPLTAEETAQIQAEIDAGRFPLQAIRNFIDRKAYARLLQHPGVRNQINARKANNGKTVLHTVLQAKLSSGTLVPTLLITHPDIDLLVKDNDDNTPLHIAAGTVQLNAQTNEDPVRMILQAYIRNNLTANQRNNAGNTWLHMAADAGNTHVIKSILRKPAYAALTDVNAQNNNGDTALIIACRNRDAYAVSGLLHAGADPFLENNNGESMASIIQNSFGQAHLLTDEERAVIEAAEQARQVTADHIRLLADHARAMAEPEIRAAFEAAGKIAAERDAVIAESVPELPGPLRGIIGGYLGFGPTLANNNPTVTAPGAPPADQE